MRRLRLGVLIATVLVLLVVNVQLSMAHNWWIWHWNRTGNPTTIRIWNFATRNAEANAAIQDWDARTILALPLRTSHTNISVFDGNFGDTGWWGLASIVDSSFGWWECWTWCHISHGHARYNSFYGGSTGTGTGSDVRGVFCQEIGHLFGLDHSNTGDCMGKGYFNNINTVGSHNASDINKYLPGGTHP